MSRCGANRSDGFTMVELLLATMLVAVVGTLAFMTFESVTHGWQSATDYLDKMQRTDYALDQVISGLRSMYYSHDGKQDERYGFVLTDNGDGDRPHNSDVIEWSKTGSAIVGAKSEIANTVHRVQVMVLEEGDNDYAEPIQKTGLYARLCGDAALIPKDDEDETDLTFANAELYQPLLIADGVVGFNCRVLKTATEAEEGTSSQEGRNAKDKFEDEFSESNAVPYKVELTFQVEQPDENLRSQTKRAPLVRIIRLPIHEQSLDGNAPPTDKEAEGKNKTKSGGKKK